MEGKLCLLSSGNLGIELPCYSRIVYLSLLFFDLRVLKSIYACDFLILFSLTK